MPVRDTIRTYLRQITFGGNDGIVTTFAIVAGFAGAQLDGTAGIGTLAVLVFGIANLIADGASMGLGEFLSDRSTRALYRQRAQASEARDREALVADLAETFIAQDVPPTEAHVAAEALISQPRLASDLTLRHRYATEAPEGAAPLARGLVIFASFIVFGLIPLLPFFVSPDSPRAFPTSVVATLIALTLLGLLRGRATREGMVRAVGETVVLGAFCAALAFGAGNLVAGLG